MTVSSQPTAPSLIGYFPGWVIHGRRYQVSDIPAKKLTHVIYAFAGVSSGGQCVSVNLQDDQINLPALLLLKQRRSGLQTLVSIGGASNSSGFSSAAGTAAGRQLLAQSCVAFIRQWGLDGIDIDWEFPAAADKQNFTALLAELRSQLDTQGAADAKHYLLTAALPATPDEYANLELNQIHQSLDWINLLAYDFYGATSSITEFAAPLYPSSTDPQPDPKKRASYNVDAAVKAYQSAGVPASKIVVGVPFFGHGWEGVPNANHGLYQATTGPAQGTWMKDGIFDFDDLHDNYVGTYLRYWNAEAFAPWLHNPDTGIMISYDDAQSLALKASYVVANNLAGVMIWQLSADDSQQSLIDALYNTLYPTLATATDVFKGTLPYASELFGVYQPLVGWVGDQALGRLTREAARNFSREIATGPAPPSPIVDPFIGGLLGCTAGNVGVLSPAGLIHLFREYFFEFASFLGPPVGHVWLSPGGTVELMEVNTRKTIVDKTTEISSETSRKTEETLTQQDDIANAVKEDNSNDMKLGVSASGGVSTPVYHADASASLNLDNARHHSQEDTHKHSRTQSEKVSSEIRRNFKTTFRTVSETTDTSSRRYVVQNTTDKLVNYELRRKMRETGVQVQHLGTRLAWQVYLDDPGNPLGLGELVQLLAASDSSSIKPPDPPTPLAPKQVEMTVYFTIFPKQGEQNIASNSDDFWVSGNPPLMQNQDNTTHMWGSNSYTATPPDRGYTLSGIALKQANAPGNADIRCVPKFQFTPGSDTFGVQLQFVNFGGHNSIVLDLLLTWNPPSPDPTLIAYAQAYAEYQEKLAAAQKSDYTNAVRERLKLVSSIKSRPSDDLRAEERDTVYGNIIQQLMKGSTDRHVTSELLRSIFDVDEMLYFVAPDFWRPQNYVPPTLKPKYPPQPASPISIPPVQPPLPLPTPDLTGNTVLSWYGYQDENWNLRSDGQPWLETRNNYLITEETQPAPKGSSLGWLIQLDGDARRNEFLNASWVKAVLPVRPGHELEALCWLQAAGVEGENGLQATYNWQQGDPPTWHGKSIGYVLEQLAQQLKASNTDINNTLATETVFEHGFDPLEGGFRATDAYQVFDQWIEVLPTDQVVAVAVVYDPKTGRQL